ncbi:MAG: UPF0149 family protein [Ectothiorhodospiraceae bacterium]
MTRTMPAYDELQNTLAEVDAEIGAAEAQGLLAGMFSAGGQVETAQWIAQVLAGTEPRGDAARRCLEALSALYAATSEGMNDSNLAFELLLPDDDADVVTRADALGNWTHGFVYGLGVGGVADESQLPKEVAEIVGHFGEISHAAGDEAGDDDEAAYQELLEFVRTGALLVREHLQPQRRREPVPVPGNDADQGSQRSH